jgi:type VI secretion system protein ImpF
LELGNERDQIAVRDPRPIRGFPLPLFDRLAQGSPESVSERRVLDANDVRGSVLLDLQRLLNTRSSMRGSLRQLTSGTVLDYGLPDFSALTPASEADRNLLAQTVAARIAAHEPRLRNVRVALGPDPASPKAVIGAIVATLVIGTIYEPVTFYVAMDLGATARPTTLT